MSALKEGDKAPDINLPTDGGGTFSLKDYAGQKIVVYFYPKDDTPGCTKESCSFSENIARFNKLGTPVVGISKCSVQKHEKFKEKHGLQFPLASDENGDVCERYGVWVEKSLYGRQYKGIERTTFLIDEAGKIEKIWHKVKVDGHTQEVLDALNKAKAA